MKRTFYIAVLLFISFSCYSLNAFAESYVEGPEIEISDVHDVASSSKDTLLIYQSDSIVFLADRFYPPYEFINSKGESAGFNIDLTRLVMKRLGISKFRILSMDWPDVLKYYDRHNQSVIIGMNWTVRKSQKYNYGPIHNYLKHCVLYRRGDNRITSFSQLVGKKVLVESGTSMEEMLISVGLGKEVISVNDYGPGIFNLSKGKYDAVVCEEAVANYFLNSLKIKNIRIADMHLPIQRYCFVGRDTALMRRIDNVLESINADGNFEALTEKWFHHNSHFYVPVAVYVILAVLLFAAIILALFTWLLIRRVDQAKSALNGRGKQMALALKSSGVVYWEFDVKSNILRTYNDPGMNFNDGKEIDQDEYFKKVKIRDIRDMQLMVYKLKCGSNENLYSEVQLWYECDNKWHYCTTTASPLEVGRDGVVTKFVGFRRDNTKLVEVQQELKVEMEKAKEADKLKSSFLANMSHDIRTPLNAIVGFANLLQEKDNAESRDEYIGLINANSELLLRLVNDILDLSKIEAGAVQIAEQEFDMSICFANILNSVMSKVPVGVKLVENNPYKECIIFSDRQRIAQILTNFITNAIKYTIHGTITASYVYENGGVKLSVSDTGIGIPEEKQHRIFQRFEKLDNFAKGTGLGLSICKAIVDTCGGKIGFFSKENQGSTFWAWIPCKKRE
ncbi:MAG TPA: transporter substrate-binding domain-containing protein [Candidatus Egerieousia sp.]|nr:transporter substrate-binding domain-containing protein [Candidatus Egerieousia sp.]